MAWRNLSLPSAPAESADTARQRSGRVLRDAGGVVIGHRSLTPEDLIAFGMAVGEEAELEAELDAADSAE